MSSSNGRKKASTGHRFFKRRSDIEPAKQPIVAIVPEAPPRVAGRKKTGLSSESTAKSYSGKSGAATTSKGLEAKNVVWTQQQQKKMSKERVSAAPVMAERVLPKEEKSSTRAHNSSSSSSVRSEPKSQRAEILNKTKKKKQQQDKLEQEKASAREGEKVSSRDDVSRTERKQKPATAHHDVEGQMSILTQTQRVREFARVCNRLSLDEMTEQFNGLPDPKKEECTVYLDPRNAEKNRYYNVYCLDKTRVTLRFLEQEGSYIHANRVEYETLKNPFIITQGPLQKTVNDFWRLVWQEKSEFIVMLCNVTEEGRRKAIEYYPSQLGDMETYGQVQVKTCMRDSENGLITTRLTIHYKDQQRVVIHYQMTEWRDCRAPVNCVRQLFLLLKNIRKGSTPAIVHCSAGIGRSGTLVALEMCLMDLANGKAVDVENVVRSLRCYRCHAVQTFEQYMAIHKFILIFGEQNECVTQAEVGRFYRMFQEYSRNLI